MNLWDETNEILNNHKKSWNDIKFITNRFNSYDNSHLYEIEKEDFERIAKKIEYDNGFGGQEINPELKIVGDRWWLERHEYDGSEWWEFKILPLKPVQSIGEAKAYLLDLDEDGNIETFFILNRR